MELAPHLLIELLIVDQGIYFEIHGETPIIHIGRSNTGEHIIYYQSLGMNKPFSITIKGDAGI